MFPEALCNSEGEKGVIDWEVGLGEIAFFKMRKTCPHLYEEWKDNI